MSGGEGGALTAEEEARWLVDRERGGWQYAVERIVAAREAAVREEKDAATRLVESLIEASSLGTEEATAARESVPREVGIAIARAATLPGPRRGCGGPARRGHGGSRGRGGPAPVLRPPPTCQRGWGLAQARARPGRAPAPRGSLAQRAAPRTRPKPTPSLPPTRPRWTASNPPSVKPSCWPPRPRRCGKRPTTSSWTARTKPGRPCICAGRDWLRDRADNLTGEGGDDRG